MTTTGQTGRAGIAGIQALLSREAGYSVAQKCLEMQEAAEARNPHLRSATHVTLHHSAWPWYTGAIGEIEVGWLLTQLGPGWFVRHSVPIGAATTDVDHLVIGPNGVFALNTKHHRGAQIWVGDYVLRVNQGNTHHLPAARSEAVNVSDRLKRKVGFPVPVRSAIVIVGETSLKDIRNANNRFTEVVSSRQLTSWLRSQPATLSETKLALIRLAAEEPDTWHVDPAAADTFRVMSRFGRLRAAVGDFPPKPAEIGRPPATIVTTPRRSTSRTGSRQARRPVAPAFAPPVPDAAPKARTNPLALGCLVVAAVVALPFALGGLLLLGGVIFGVLASLQG